MITDITLFGINIPIYGICFFAGILISSIIAIFLIKKTNIDLFDFLCAVAFILIGTIIGAKVLFILVSIDLIVEYNLTFIEILKGGFVFYGGLIGGAIALYLYCKIFKLPLLPYFSTCSVVVPLGHAIGRIGCFFAGCCYGIEYDGFLSHVYKSSINPLTPIGVPLLPIQLIEAVILLIVFFVVIYQYLKNPNSYASTVTYALSYAIARFVLEFFRGDAERGLILYLSTSQWISILIIAFIAIKLINKNHKNIYKQ